MDKTVEILKETGIPFAYDHFAEGESPSPPFVCYLMPGSENFSADGKVYKKICRVNIELYTDFKDIETERKIEDILDRKEIFYDKTEAWIEDEKLYEVLYEYTI